MACCGFSGLGHRGGIYLIALGYGKRRGKKEGLDPDSELSPTEQVQSARSFGTLRWRGFSTRIHLRCDGKG